MSLSHGGAHEPNGLDRRTFLRTRPRCVRKLPSSLADGILGGPDFVDEAAGIAWVMSGRASARPQDPDEAAGLVGTRTL